jgi:hypothetical protein
MKKKNTLISKAEKTPYKEVVSFIKQKKFALAHLGITNKMSFDWRAAGVYLQEKQGKYRMKYSAIEYIWLLLVKELRSFGLPIKAVIKLKDFLLMPVDVEKLLLAIQKETDVVEELNDVFGGDFKKYLGEGKEVGGLFKEELGVYEGSESDLSKDIKEVGKSVVDSMFASMLISTFLKEENYYLLIKKEGTCLIEMESSLSDSGLNPLESFTESSCLRIPLKMIVKEFLKKEEVEEYDLSDNEKSKVVKSSKKVKSNKENKSRVNSK